MDGTIELVTWAWAQSPTLGAAGKLVLVLLASHAGADNRVAYTWQRRDNLSRAACLSVQALDAHLASLESDGFLVRGEESVRLLRGAA